MTARMPRRSWSAGRGALLIVASLLLLSALVRLGAGSGAAIALEIQNARAAAGDGDVELEDISPDLVALLEATRDRERALDAREADIEARMQALALVESAVAEDLSRLEAAENKLRQTISDARFRRTMPRYS